MADRVGEQLGNYRLLQLLGQGNFAEVYLGEHLHLNTQAAIKVLHAHFSRQDEERFRTEARTIARLVHPHIVRILDFDVEEGLPFLVMDYAPGGSLRKQHPKGTRLSLDTVVSSVIQIASALQYAHDEHLIHRDVKPENLLLGRNNEVLLSDFGLALLAQSSHSKPGQETAGTIAYMAPEQLQAHPTSASDQYALGVVVYEWLSGDRPFRGSFPELALKQTLASPPSLCEQVPTLPPAVEQVVFKALAKDPKERFARVQDFALALEAACRGDPSSGQTQLILSSEYPAKAERATTHHLPTPLTPLIGREREIAAACTLLRRPEVRLVTLIGTGGSGKTRLGLQVAAELSDHFADGVFFVNLAPISDPELVVPTIAQVLDVKESGAQSLLDLLKAFLRDKCLLLVLDNFEQLLPAAPRLSDLLACCPELNMLVTSRATLHVQGEHELPVPPLAVPDLTQLPPPDALSHYAAVALFLQRAQAMVPTFQLTATNARALAEICVRLDGLPLAIELAAARSKLLPPQALLARLGQRLAVLTGGVRDAPARQHTLRNTIEWSYRLLDAEEQRLFQRLSVFVGGCTLEAVEAVSSACGSGTLSVLDGVASLLDKSLVRQSEPEGEEPRLVMLETIREYAWEALEASEEAEATRQAHAVYYLGLAEAAALTWSGPQGGRSFARLSQEHDNLRAVMNWLLERGETEMALRLGVALPGFWRVGGSRYEEWNFLEWALAGSEEVAIAVRAKAFDAAGELAVGLGHFERGAVLCEQSLALFREIGDTKGMGDAVYHLALITYSRADWAVARSLFEECIELSSEAGDKDRVAEALNKLGMVAAKQGEFVRARALLEEGLALFRELGDILGIPDSLFWLALVLFWQGDLERAHVLVEEGLALIREMDLRRTMEASPLALLGEITFYQGDTTTARLLFEKSCALFREVGYEPQIVWARSLVAKVSAAQGDLAASRALYEESLIPGKGVNSNLDYEDIAPALEGLAAVVAAQGEPTWAARLWGRAEAHRDAYGLPLAPVYRADYERSVAAARAQLGEKAFAAAWAEGRGMTPEQVLAARGPATMPAPVSTTHPSSPPPAKSPPTYPNDLTEREVEVLRLLSQGLTNAQLAEQLILSPYTVHAHLRSIFSKLGVSSRSAATRFAFEHQLV